MSAPLGEGQTLVLGAVAGATIVLGLPLGRVRAPRPALRQFLNALAIGILGFLLWDVLSGAFEPVDGALADLHEQTAGIGPVFGYGLLFFGGLTLGLMGLVYYERWLGRRRSAATHRTLSAAAVTDRPERGVAAWSVARQTALLIAVGIGLHNFGEGLAIGGSAATGAIGLATVLVIGFALHNATEGFGIVGPLGDVKPSWRWLALAGLIGGGPTFIGSMVGYNVTSQPLELLFYAVAGGAILYVIGEIWHGMRRYGHRERGLVLLCAGFTAGVLTDLVVAYGGG